MSALLTSPPPRAPAALPTRPDRGAQAWLRAEAVTGRSTFRASAMWSGLATLAMVGQIAALALVLGAEFDSQHGSRWPYAALAVAATAVRLTAQRAATLAASAGGQQIVGAIRGRLLDHVFVGGSRRQDSPAATADTVVEQTERLAGYYERYEPLRLAVVVNCSLIAAAALAVNWVVAAMLVLATPFVPINMAVVGLGANEASKRQLQQVRELSATVLDRIRALPMLAGLDAVDAEAQAVRHSGTELRRRTMQVLRLALLSSSVLDLVSTFAIAVVATYVGLVLLGFLQTAVIPDHVSLAQAMYLLLLTPAYFAPLRTLAAAYHDRANAVAAAEVIKAAVDPDGTRGAVPPREDRPQPVGPLAVRLNDVTVTYPGRARPALQNITLEVPAGQVVAVVGASGAGKSTLLAVAAGLLEPSEGCASHVDPAGRDFPPSPAAVAWGSQRAVLFSGSLSDNIVVGATGRSANDLDAAIDAAGLRDVVDLRAHRGDTVLSEDGRGLSGGERQRLGLARALYKDAPLIMLDEPTAHLDAATEIDVVDVLRRVLTGRTALVATHSPVVMSLADRVVTLEDGLISLPNQPVVLAQHGRELSMEAR